MHSFVHEGTCEWLIMCVFVTLFWTFIWSISAIVIADGALHYKQFSKRLHDRFTPPGTTANQHLPWGNCKIPVVLDICVPCFTGKNFHQVETAAGCNFLCKIIISGPQTALGPVVFSQVYIWHCLIYTSSKAFLWLCLSDGSRLHILIKKWKVIKFWDQMSCHHLPGWC